MTSRQRWTLVATIIGSGAVFLDGTIVNVALKQIGQQLPASVVGVLEGQTYVVSGYLATLAALLILSGALADHYGRRRVYSIGLAGFAATSALCGLAPSLEWLVVFRLAQGAAGALLVPGSIALITHAFDDVSRGRAFGMWAASTAALTVLAPALGGLIVDTAGWRLAFLINIPLLAVALWATRRHVAESRDTEATARFDWLGALVAVLAVGGLAFGLIRGQSKEWADPAAWAAIVVGIVCLVLFPVLMSRRANPLVPLSLFRSRDFTTVNVATFFIYGALYVSAFYQAVLLQGVLGYTALGAGIVGMPVGIILALLSTRIGAIAGRVGSRRFLLIGPTLMGVAALWYARIPADSTPWKASLANPASLIPPPSVFVDILPYAIIFGLGLACVVAPLTNALMACVPGRYSGLGSAINNSISRVGQPLLGAIIFIALSATYYATLGNLAPGLDTESTGVRSVFQPLNPAPAIATPAQVAAATQASIDAFHLAMTASAGLLFTGTVTVWFGLRQAGYARAAALAAGAPDVRRSA